MYGVLTVVALHQFASDKKYVQSLTGWFASGEMGSNRWRGRYLDQGSGCACALVENPLFSSLVFLTPGIYSIWLQFAIANNLSFLEELEDMSAKGWSS